MSAFLPTALGLPLLFGAADFPSPSADTAIVRYHSEWIVPCFQRNDLARCDSFSVLLESRDPAGRYEILDGLVAYLHASAAADAPAAAAAIFDRFWKDPLLRDAEYFGYVLRQLTGTSTLEATRTLTLGFLDREISRSRFLGDTASVGSRYVRAMDSIATFILTHPGFSNEYKYGFPYLERLADTLKTESQGYAYRIDSVSSPARLFRIFAFDSASVHVVGGEGTILRSMDGGKSWQRSGYTGGETLTGIHFKGRDTGWITDSRRLVLKTINGGDQWRPVEAVSEGLLSGVSFGKGKNGVLFGLRLHLGNSILYTGDGGVSWTPASMPAADNTIWDVHYRSEVLAWAIDSEGHLLRTLDGGKTWASQELSGVDTGSRLELRDIHFSRDSVGWIVGKWGLVLNTMDGGRTWRELPKMFYGHFQGIDFLDSLTGCIVGEPDVVFFTRDGGATWTREDIELFANLSQVELLSASSGIILSERNQVIRFEAKSTIPQGIRGTEHGGLHGRRAPYVVRRIQGARWTDGQAGTQGGWRDANGRLTRGPAPGIRLLQASGVSEPYAPPENTGQGAEKSSQP